MSMTITEATAVNNLLEWLLDENPHPSHRAEAWHRAMGAASTLAGSAHKSLMAGMTPADVNRLWAVRNGTGELRRRRAAVREKSSNCKSAIGNRQSAGRPR